MVSDERAPGVSAALRKRIGAALEAGERPWLQRNNLRLGSIVLQRADGRDAPALREVAIQMSSRGLDVAGVPCVINYDLPHSAEDYVHRIGRAGRAGRVGHALTFING